MPKRAKSQKKMVQYSYRTKLSPVRKNGTIRKQWQNLSRVKNVVQFSNRTNLSPVRKRWYKTETGPKPVYRQKKDGLILKRSKLSPVRKRWYNTEKVQKPVSSQKNVVQYSNRAKTCHQSEKDVKYSNRAKTCQEFKKRWCNTQTEQRCHNLEKDGTILKQGQNLAPVRKRWYNTQTEPNTVKQYQNLLTVRKRLYNTKSGPEPDTSQKKDVKYSNRDKTCQQSKKDGTILKKCKNLSPVRK